MRWLQSCVRRSMLTKTGCQSSLPPQESGSRHWSNRARAELSARVRADQGYVHAVQREFLTVTS